MGKPAPLLGIITQPQADRVLIRQVDDPPQKPFYTCGFDRFGGFGLNGEILDVQELSVRKADKRTVDLLIALDRAGREREENTQAFGRLNELQAGAQNGFM